MIKTLLFDFSRVLLLPKDQTYKGELNVLHKDLSAAPEYSFAQHFFLNEPLIEYLQTLQKEKDLYIFTSGSIQNVDEIKVKLDPVFKEVFSAQELGISKKDPEAYLKVISLIIAKPEEVLFIDDSPENVGAAQRAGLHSFQYTNFEEFSSQIQKII